MIMCQYLFAEFSLRDGTDEGLTDEQAEAVDRWPKVLHGTPWRRCCTWHSSRT
jgi:hypothetical protein